MFGLVLSVQLKTTIRPTVYLTDGIQSDISRKRQTVTLSQCTLIYMVFIYVSVV